MTTLAICSAERPASEPSNWRRMTARVWPASRSASNSPTQTIGSQPGGQGGVDLLVDGRVGFAQDVPAFAVAEDDVRAAEVAEHGGAEFAGEGPVLLVIHVLGAQGDLRAGDRPAHGVEIAAWRADGQIDAVERLRPAFATPSANATAEARFEFIFQLPAINGRRINDAPQ